MSISIESREEFQVQVASTRVTYELDASGRVLRVKRVEPHG